MRKIINSAPSRLATLTAYGKAPKEAHEKSEGYMTQRSRGSTPVLVGADAGELASISGSPSVTILANRAECDLGAALADATEPFGGLLRPN